MSDFQTLCHTLKPMSAFSIWFLVTTTILILKSRSCERQRVCLELSVYNVRIELCCPFRSPSNPVPLEKPLLIIWVYCHTTPTFGDSFVGFINSFPNTCLRRGERSLISRPRPLIRPISSSNHKFSHFELAEKTSSKKSWKINRENNGPKNALFEGLLMSFILNVFLLWRWCPLS